MLVVVVLTELLQHAIPLNRKRSVRRELFVCYFSPGKVIIETCVIYLIVLEYYRWGHFGTKTRGIPGYSTPC